MLKSFIVITYFYYILLSMCKYAYKSYLVKIDKESVAAAAQSVFVSPIKEHQSTNEVDFADGFYEIRRPADSEEFLYCKTEGEGVVSGDTLIINAGVYSGKNDAPRTEASLYKKMNTKIIFKDGTIKVAEYQESH